MTKCSTVASARPTGHCRVNAGAVDPGDPKPGVEALKNSYLDQGVTFSDWEGGRSLDVVPRVIEMKR